MSMIWKAWKNSGLILGAILMCMGVWTLLTHMQTKVTTLQMNQFPDSILVDLGHIEHNLTKIQNELTGKKVIPRGSKADKKSAELKAFSPKNSLSLLTHTKNTLSQIDTEMNTWAQGEANRINNIPVAVDYSWAWLTFGLFVIGLTLITRSVFSIIKYDNDLAMKEVSREESKEPAYTFMVPEKVIFDSLPQSIFYLSSTSDVLWANKAARKLDMTREHISKMLSQAYQNESGKRMASFGQTDYELSVEYLDALDSSGKKVFCLIMNEVTEGTLKKVETHPAKSSFHYPTQS